MYGCVSLLSKSIIVRLGMVVLMIAGCVAAIYVPPTVDKMAFLKVSVEAGVDYSAAALVIDGYKDAKSCKGRLHMQDDASALLKAGSSGQVTIGFERIAADDAFSLRIGHTMRDYFYSEKYCSIVVSFVPEVGRYYLATYLERSDRCGMELRSADNELMENSRLESFQKMQDRTPLLDSGSWCKS